MLTALLYRTRGQCQLYPVHILLDSCAECGNALIGNRRIIARITVQPFFFLHVLHMRPRFLDSLEGFFYRSDFIERYSAAIEEPRVLGKKYQRFFRRVGRLLRTIVFEQDPCVVIHGRPVVWIDFEKLLIVFRRRSVVAHVAFDEPADVVGVGRLFGVPLYLQIDLEECSNKVTLEKSDARELMVYVQEFWVQFYRLLKKIFGCLNIVLRRILPIKMPITVFKCALS